jgi:hypothetical protein
MQKNDISKNDTTIYCVHGRFLGPEEIVTHTKVTQVGTTDKFPIYVKFALVPK